MASDITLSAPLVFLAEGQWRISRTAEFTIRWSEPSKKNPVELVERTDVFVKAVKVEGKVETKVVLKVNGRFWEDCLTQFKQVDSIARKFGKAGYDPKDWIVKVNAEKRIETVE